MELAREALPDDVAALKAALAAERAQKLAIEAELAIARAKASEDMALIARQKLRIAKLERQVYGQRSERSARLIEQLALEFEEFGASAAEDELAAERALARTTNVRGFTRRPAERNTFPEHLPRERVVIDPPKRCECCGGLRVRKLGEDVTRTLETEPRRWKVIETVREKFSCRDCEAISQPPAPYHVVPRGWAGPSLLAMIMFEKFGQHQPLNRQCERYALEGAPIALSTLADAVGAVVAAIDPLRRLIEAHVLAAERLHGDDTTVPVLAKGKTDTARCWIYVRDDRPFGGADPPAAIFYYSRDRRGEHPQRHLTGYSGILQADAYDGFNPLYLAERKPAPIREAACWANARRKFYVLADIEEKPDGKRRARRKSRFLRSPWRWCAAWTRCSRSSARSTASALRNVQLFAKSQAALWSTICSSTCASRRQNFRADTISSRRSSTCSSAGPPSRYSSTTDASASRRMVLTRGNCQPGVAVMAGAVGGFSFHAATIRS